MFCSREFAPRYFASRYWPKVGLAATNIKLFAGRGPDANGNITPLIADYDSFFLTQTEGDGRYLQTVPAEYLTQTEGDARYIQSVPSEYITQTEANDQGMPALESVAYSGGGTPSDPVTHGTGNITLRTPSSPKDFWQARCNTGTSEITVSPPTNYTISGSAIIIAGGVALFVKIAGASQFLRWGA